MPLSDLLADQVAVLPLRNYTYVTVGEGYSGGGYKIGCASSTPRVVDAPTPRLEPARVPAANVEDSTAESPDAAEGPVLENVSQCATSCTVHLTRSVLVVAQLATCLPRRDYDSCFTCPTYAARVRQNTGTFAVRPGSHQGCLGRRRTQRRPIERSVVICYRFFGFIGQRLLVDGTLRRRCSAPAIFAPVSAVLGAQQSEGGPGGSDGASSSTSFRSAIEVLASAQPPCTRIQRANFVPGKRDCVHSVQGVYCETCREVLHDEWIRGSELGRGLFDDA